MDVSETKSDGLLREYKIVIKAGELEADVNKKLLELAGTVKVPGFRPGKVPLSVLKTRFGEQARGEALKSALDEGARQAIEGNKLRLASQPQVDLKSFDDGKDIEASLACELMPEIKIPDLAKIAIEKPSVENDPKEVEEAIEKIADENRLNVSVGTPRPAILGDVVVIDFIGRVDGKEFEGGAADGHSLELGSNSFIPGFEDGLIGAKVSETRDVVVNFPEDYQAKHLAGKKAIFEVTVKDLQQKSDASVDDELAKRLGFEDLNGLREAVNQQINGQHQTALRQLVKKNVLDALAQGDAFDVPPTIYRQEYDSVVRAMRSDTSESDETLEALDAEMTKGEKKEASQIASRRVRLGLLITEIGRENNIEVSEEDTRQAMFEEARRYPGQEQMVLEYFQKNPEAMQQISGPIFEDKVIDFILEMAKVSEVVITKESLYKLDEGKEKAGDSKATKRTAAKAKGKKTSKETGNISKTKSTAKKSTAKKSTAKKSTAKKPKKNKMLS